MIDWANAIPANGEIAVFEGSLTLQKVIEKANQCTLDGVPLLGRRARVTIEQAGDLLANLSASPMKNHDWVDVSLAIDLVRMHGGRYSNIVHWMGFDWDIVST